MFVFIIMIPTQKRAPAAPFSLVILEQTGNVAFAVNVHVNGSRLLTQTRHRHHAARQCYDKARTQLRNEFANVEREVGWSSQFRLIVGK